MAFVPKSKILESPKKLESSNIPLHQLVHNPVNIRPMPTQISSVGAPSPRPIPIHPAMAGGPAMGMGMPTLGATRPPMAAAANPAQMRGTGGAVGQNFGGLLGYLRSRRGQ